MQLAIVFFLCCLVLEVKTLGTVQSAAVTGKLLCNGQPYPNAKVKLYEIDLADPDDLMAEGRSDKHGKFVLRGSESEITRISVKLNIYHNCHDETTEGLRKFEITIPDNYIAEGPNPTKTFDAGTFNLQAVYPGETRDFIN